jgi:hypothetical protein
MPCMEDIENVTFMGMQGSKNFDMKMDSLSSHCRAVLYTHCRVQMNYNDMTLSDNE